MMASGGHLLDTNIVIHLLRNNVIGQHIDTRFGLSASFASSMVSIVTIGELYSFAMKLGWGEKRRDALQDIVDEIVAIDINSEDILQCYAEIDHFSEQVVKPARPMGKNDIWIAATAKATGATLLTTDRDFDHLDGVHIQRIWIDPNTNTP